MYLKKHVQHNLKQSFRHASFKTLTIRCALRRLLCSYNSMLASAAYMYAMTCILYLGPHTSTADVPGRRALRSAGANRLVVPPVRLATVGSRAFPVAAAHTWNSLPEHIVSASTLQPFKRHLKTFLLQQSFRLALQWTSQ